MLPGSLSRRFAGFAELINAVGFARSRIPDVSVSADMLEVCEPARSPFGRKIAAHSRSALRSIRLGNVLIARRTHKLGPLFRGEGGAHELVRQRDEVANFRSRSICIRTYANPKTRIEMRAMAEWLFELGRDCNVYVALRICRKVKKGDAGCYPRVSKIG